MTDAIEQHRACLRGQHDLRVVARQAPWLGYWRVGVECLHCSRAGSRIPGLWWRRRKVDAVVKRQALYLGIGTAQ